MKAPETVTHAAGASVQFGTLLRQRCEWCGSILIDVDLARISVPVGQDPTYPTWEPGKFVDAVMPDQQGGMQALNDWTEGPVPETSCMRMPPELTA